MKCARHNCRCVLLGSIVANKRAPMDLRLVIPEPKVFWHSFFCRRGLGKRLACSPLGFMMVTWMPLMVLKLVKKLISFGPSNLYVDKVWEEIHVAPVGRHGGRLSATNSPLNVPRNHHKKDPPRNSAYPNINGMSNGARSPIL